MSSNASACDNPLVPSDGVHVRYDPHPAFDRVVWAYGFRPFFLAAAGYAVVGSLAWVGFWYGLIELPAAVPAIGWHGHEMVFGFAGAALCGFLLTATPEWTGTRPWTGRWLALAFGLWLAGRLAMWAGGVLPLAVVAAINLSLFPLLAIQIIPSLWRDPNRRHRSFIPLVPLLWLAQLATFLGWMGGAAGQDGEAMALRVLNGGLHVFLVAIVLTVTRISMVVVPLALAEQGDTRSRFRPIPPRRNLATATLVLFVAADLAAPDNPVAGWIALAAAAAQLDRMADWHVGRVLLKPYVLTLYIANAWLAIGLAGVGTDALVGWDATAASRHALTLGAVGTAVLGVLMIAGLRHTGRDLVIPRAGIVAVALLSAGTALRVVAPSVVPDLYLPVGLGGASVLWAGGFAVYLAAFAPLLLRPRADGRPG